MIRHVVSLLAVAALLTTLQVVAGEAEAAKPATTDEAVKKDATEATKAVMPEKLSEHEAKLHALIVAALPGEKREPGRKYMKARRLETVTLRKTILRALEKNLTIVRQGKLEEIAKVAVEEAKAVFDPIFSASVTYDRTEKFNRKEKARRYRRATEPFDLNGNGVIDSGEENVLLLDKEVQDQIGIFALVFRNPRPAGLVKDFQRASREGAEGPTDSLDYKLTVTQQLPWGNSVAIGYTLRRKETFFLPGFRIISPQTREYNRPYASTIDVNIVAPAPFLKDFGRHSSAETGVELALLDKERAFWDTKTVINSTLLIVDLAYWDVVGTLESVRAAIENRKVLEAQVKTVEERLKAGRTTDYGYQQSLSQMASVKSFEESAWNAYERASNSLVTVLDLDDKTVVFPVGYSQFADMKLSSDEEQVVATGLKNRPEIAAEKVSAQSTDILLLFAENQKRPDLKLGIGLSFIQQLEQLFGYSSFGNSIKSITRPDTVAQDYSATYNRPWDNRALEAAHRQAIISVKQQDITLKDTTNLVEQQLSDALVGYLSSKKKVEIAKTTLEKARTAQKQAQTLYDAGRLTEFEQLSKTSDLLVADLEFISAAVAFKKSEAQLLHAQGLLASRYVERSSTGVKFDQNRVKVMAASREMQFFTPMEPETPAKPKAEVQPVTAETKKDL